MVGRTAMLLAAPIALAYVALAWLVTHYFFLISPIWPSAAVATAAVMLYGRAGLPGIFIGSFIANHLLMNWAPLGAVITSLGNALGPLIGVYFYRRMTHDDYFVSPKSVGCFVLTLGLLSNSVSAIIGMVGVSVFHFEGIARLTQSFISWWVGDLSSAIMLAPAIYLWGKWLQSKEAYPHEQQGRDELIFVALMITGGSLVLFGIPGTGNVLHIGAMSLVLPPLVWAAQRFNPRIALTLFATLYVIALGGTIMHRGPFATFPLGAALTALQLMGASIGSAILVASVLDLQRRKVTASLREMNESLADKVAERTLELARSERHMRHILEMSPIPMLVTELESSRILFVNDECLHLYGIHRSEAKNVTLSELWVDPNQRQEIIQRLKMGEVIRNHEVAFKDLQGEILWLSIAVVLTQLDQKDALMFAFKDISLHKVREAELLTQATTDVLTGLYNRRQVRELCHRLIQEPKKGDLDVSICIFDLDHFKKINDNFGHACGDKVLRTVADMAQLCLRDHDILGRWGGEEFVLILPNTPVHRACILIERLRAKLTESAMLCDNGHLISFSASFGVAGGVLHPHTTDFDLFDTWLNHADRALYRAKENGRNCIESH